ncbi:MAG TPA: dihydroorotase, partial [Candidatus Dormibacteraeota bacterium]|nr:dihydroorotase [Candidatus Dormibacteraeota bacterium]
MNVLIRGVRVIDPAQQLDEIATDVRIEDGRVLAIGRHLDAGPLPVLDMTPADGRSWRVVSPGFIDLHAHLREPGEGESVASGARAAAAG